MHTELERHIRNNQSTLNVVGIYEGVDIISSGSDCKYGHGAVKYLTRGYGVNR